MGNTYSGQDTRGGAAPPVWKMIFTETKLKGVFLIELERCEDERGFFATNWSAEEFAGRGLSSSLAECNISFNKKKGTLRGMHYQLAPCSQVKLVRCTRGALYDVALDLRPGSPTFRCWVAAELTEDNYKMFYIPEGFAHGYQTLADNTEVAYAMSASYSPEHARGLRWDDPTLAIEWPEAEDRIISERDRTYSLLSA